jgi:hypothetical protein
MPSAPVVGNGGASVRVAFPDRDLGPELGERAGDAAADARSSAGHHRDPSGEEHRSRADAVVAFAGHPTLVPAKNDGRSSWLPSRLPSAPQARVAAVLWQGVAMQNSRAARP